jgi:hypothetical protein
MEKPANRLTAERMAATARLAHPCLARPGRRDCLCSGCRAYREAALDVLEAMGVIALGERVILPDFGEEDPDTPIAKARAAARRHREQSGPPPVIEPPSRGVTVPAGLRDLPAPARPPTPEPRPLPVPAVQPARSAPEPTRRRHPAQCGTPSGYARHRRQGEAACDQCKTAMSDAHRDRAHRRGVPRRKQAAPCGTSAGARGHRRRGEPPCAPCREAWKTYQRERYHARQTPHQRAVDLPVVRPGVDLDEWLSAAQRSTRPAVRRRAQVALVALLQLRCALDDLARAERTS